MKLLWHYLRPYRFRTLLLGFCIVGVIAFQLLTPQILSQFIDLASQQAPLGEVMRLAGLFWVVAALSYGVNISRTYFKETVAWKATNDLRNDLARHCLHLDLTYHHEHAPGELIERVDGDVAKLSRFFSELFLIAVSNVLLLIGVLGALLLENWQIGLVFTLFSAFAMLILYAMKNFAQHDFEAVRQNEAAMYGFIDERLSGTEDLRANGGGAYALYRLFGMMRTYAHSMLQAYHKIIGLRVTTSLIFAAGSIIAVGMSVWLFQTGSITLGTVYLIYAYVRMLLTPIERLVLELQEFQTASASLKRIQMLLDTPLSIVDGQERFPTGEVTVRFEKVTFGYGATPLLQDFSFELPAKQMLGLVGRTGSGKTTIARLLLRLYDVQQGSICFNDTDVRDIQLDELRNKVALVTQDVQIFHATVRENLTLFDSTISDQRLLRVIDDLRLRNWFNGLPAGLDTLLDATSLSAGEAQLMAFARVFLRDPQIIILDEASSRVDPETQQMIDEVVTRLFENRTGIIIAHRLETVQKVDQVMVLREGRIVEYGARVALEANPESVFAQLLRSTGERLLI
jgi:ATP-binding cassette, subfamily B, bacterial